MNEFDFRVWDKKDKIMIYDFDCDEVGWMFAEPLKISSNNIIYPNSSGSRYNYFCGKFTKVNKNRTVIMQYIGAKDLKDKKIYFDDLVKDKNKDEFEVFWDEENLKVALKRFDTIYSFDKNVVVIGNKWEDGTR